MTATHQQHLLFDPNTLDRGRYALPPLAGIVDITHLEADFRILSGTFLCVGITEDEMGDTDAAPGSWREWLLDATDLRRFCCAVSEEAMMYFDSVFAGMVREARAKCEGDESEVLQ